MKTTTENLKRIFKSYEEVRLAGKHNMFTEAKDAERAAGLTNEEYWYVLENYTAIRNIIREEENRYIIVDYGDRVSYESDYKEIKGSGYFEEEELKDILKLRLGESYTVHELGVANNLIVRIK